MLDTSKPRDASISASAATRTIGIDLSGETSTYVTVGAEGSLLGEGKFPTTAEGLDSAFGEGPASRVVLEASTQTHWVARRLGGMGSVTTTSRSDRSPRRSFRRPDCCAKCPAWGPWSPWRSR